MQGFIYLLIDNPVFAMKQNASNAINQIRGSYLII